MKLIDKYKDYINNMESEIYRERFKKRTIELDKYFEKNKAIVKIVLPEEQRDLIATQSSGSKTGKDFNKLSMDKQEMYSESLSSFLWSVMQKHQYAFGDKHYNYYVRWAKKNFK